MTDTVERMTLMTLDDRVLNDAGDVHWSKLLQVNGSDDDMRLVRRLSSKHIKKEKEKDQEKDNEYEIEGKEKGKGQEKEASQQAKERSRDRVSGGGEGGLEVYEAGSFKEGGFVNGSSTEGTCSVCVINPRPRHGLLTAMTSRIRQWLGSRRKYEISPRESFFGTSASSDLSQPAIKPGTLAVSRPLNTAGCKPGGQPDHAPPVKDNVLEVDAALNRCGTGHLSPCLRQRSPNGYAAAAAAETGKIPLQRSPVSRRDASRIRPPTTPRKARPALTHTAAPAFLAGASEAGGGRRRSKSPVDIKIQVVDVSGLSPSPLSPSASRLLASSRRHLLRQSRSKLKERAVLVTSLVPTGSSLIHQPLTTTISCPPQAEALAGMAVGTDRRCHSWPLPRRKAFPGQSFSSLGTLPTCIVCLARLTSLLVRFELLAMPNWYVTSHSSLLCLCSCLQHSSFLFQCVALYFSSVCMW